MISQTTDFLSDLADAMLKDFSDHGALVQRRSGTIIFKGVVVYYRRVSSDLLRLVIGQDSFELPL